MKNPIDGFIDFGQPAITEETARLCYDVVIIIELATKYPEYVTIRVYNNGATIINEQKYRKHLNDKIGIVGRVRAGPLMEYHSL